MPARSSQPSSGGLSTPALLTFGALLALPAYALVRMRAGVDRELLTGAAIVLSITTFLTYRSDKRRAETEDQRIPELTLHFLELMGGWPGAFLAQRVFRHKNAKISYQLVFWLIVLLHEYLALDASLFDGQLSRSLLSTHSGR